MERFQFMKHPDTELARVPRSFFGVSLLLAGAAVFGCAADAETTVSPRRSGPADGGTMATADAQRDVVSSPPDQHAPSPEAAPDGTVGPADTGGTVDVGGSVDGGATDGAVGQPDGAAGPWATGVQIALVEIAQAVFIKVGDGNAVVPPASRNSTLIEQRAAFLRLHVRPEAGFAPRTLRAVLMLEYADGSKRPFEDRKTISAASDTERLDSTFNYLLPADAMKPDAKLVASVYETGAPMGPDPAKPPRFPSTGSADLGIRGGPMLMDVVLLPVRGPSGPLDDSPARRRRLESYLADVYPAQKMTITWHAPLTINSIIDSNEAWRMMERARNEDNAPAGSYYHMLIAVEDSVDKYLGLGSLAGPTPGDAADRLAMTMVTAHRVDSQIDTVSHEMGHNLGRNHAPGCDAAGTDRNFPYANTGVGVDGYSVGEMVAGVPHLPNSTGPFKSKTKFKDVMGYCYPTWISDYTWNAFAERIRIVSGFPPVTLASSPRRSLKGFYAPGGKAHWALVPGGGTPQKATITPSRWASIQRADGSRTTVPIELSFRLSPAGPEDKARTLTLDIPEGDVARVDVMVDGDRFVVTAADLAAH
jgi:hypothetical protein